MANTDDDPRDPHLLAALRHAPDRDVAPPARVTAAILSQAQQAVRAGRPTWRDSLRTAFGASWRPAPMAAFGTLALATLIGVMWSGQDLPEPTPSLRPESAAPAAAPAPPPTDTVAPASAAPAAPAIRAEPEPARVVRRQKESKSESKAAASRRLAESGAGTAPPPAAPPPAQPAPPAVTATQQAPQEREARSDGLAKSMADAAAPAPARARSEMAAPAALGAAMPRVASPLAQAGAEIDAAMASMALARAQNAAPIDAAKAGDATRVYWRLAADRLVAHGPAQRDWWSALVRSTSGRWQPAASAAAAGEPLVLLIDGAARGSLSFEPQAVVWRDANGATWRAPVAAESLYTLQAFPANR